MPVYCLELTSDTFPKTKPITYESSITHDNMAFEIQCSSNGFQGYGDCGPKVVNFPLPSPFSYSNIVWIVKQSDYKSVVAKLPVDSVCNPGALQRAGLSYLSFKNIKSLGNWAMESDTGFCATHLKVWYGSLYSAAGVTCRATLTQAVGGDSVVDCYLIVRDYSTLRWKEK